MSKPVKSIKKSKAAIEPAVNAIVASSQTSRFHVDTLTTLSQEVDLHQVNISIGLNDLLVDAHLRLKTGIHYALVGRNGEGKSTLLKAIAERIIPGISDNLRILLVSQVADETVLSNQDPDISIVDRVVKSDYRREKALGEYQLLMDGYEASSPSAIAQVVHAIRLSRARDELEEAEKIAQRRSGTRGSEARKQLLKAEANVSSLEEVQPDATDTETALAATALLADVQSTLDATLSGGWRSRCSLANALLQQPDILILDEPTNYLDIMSVMWLQYYLDTIDSTLLVVAHDRDFVDHIAQETIIFRKQSLSYFDGNLTEYERYSLAERKGKIKMKDALDKKRSVIEKTIELGARSAKKTGDENRARMVKSRQKKLDDRWGLEKSDKGTRFKRNRDLPAYLLTSRLEIEIPELDRPIKFTFPDPEPMRFPGALISAQNVSFNYPKSSTQVLVDVNLTVHPGARVGLVGRNGEGKSTLVKVLTGDLKPVRGTVERHPRLKFGYFDQHSVESLSGAWAENASACTHLIRKLKEDHSIEIDEQTARSFLGSLGLHGRTAASAISTLSGGQKVRLALAIIVYPSPDLLVLDEVTTHLDKDTIIALISALKRYSGAILLVTHDRYFTRCVIEGAPVLPPSEEGDSNDEDTESDDEGGESTAVGDLYVVGPKGKVALRSGGMDSYVTLLEKRVQKLGIGPKG
ncbi:P-loop containing nucleoside triphosphate hydrolase protein [Infundibulicybe gibba]|nr:P-loop containing nucleoside triphosphate hydrolase protein [Infundibulicybe gibba]